MRRSRSLWHLATSAICLCLAAVLSLVIAATPLSAEQPKFNLPEARKCVVHIKRITPGWGPGVGSGFLIDKDGLIYTNRHVVVSPDETLKSMLLVGVPSAKDADVLEYYRAETVHVPAAKEKLDFAVLKIAAKGAFPALPLSFDKAALGSDVAAIGYPAVLADQPNLSFTKGSVTTTKATLEDRAYYQTDAAINPGNSGGPLVNAKGEAIGIVTSRLAKARNIGFALYLSEIKETADKAKQLAAKVKPEPGPIDLKKLPVLASIAPKSDNWEVGAGTVKEGKGVIAIDNNGGQYWLTSKKPLPENFQLLVMCQVIVMQGKQVLQPSQRTMIQSLVVRCGTADTKAKILERKGYMLRYGYERILLYKEGEKDAVKMERIGNPDDPFLLVITKQGGAYTVTVEGEVVLKYRDEKPLDAKGHKFSIGGYLSRLILGEVSVIDLGPGDAPKGKKDKGKE